MYPVILTIGSISVTSFGLFLAVGVILGVFFFWRLSRVYDLSEEINDQFSDLLNNFRDTIILVFITFLLFLGVRQALIAVLTIPLTFLSTFTIMSVTGLSINFLSNTAE